METQQVLSEFRQDDGLTRNTGGLLQKWKGSTDLYKGPRDFYRSHYLEITLQPLMHAVYVVIYHVIIGVWS